MRNIVEYGNSSEKRVNYLTRLSLKEIEVQLALGSFSLFDLWVLKEMNISITLNSTLHNKISHEYCVKLLGLSNNK